MPGLIDIIEFAALMGGVVLFIILVALIAGDGPDYPSQSGRGAW